MVVFKLKQDFFDKAYIKGDYEQVPYTLVGIKLGPGHICYHLSDGTGELIELYDAEVSFERDEALRLSYVTNEND